MISKVPEHTLTVLHFSSLQNIPTLRHAITTRHGGSSTRPHESLNLGFHVGDDPHIVQHNRRAVAQSCGFDPQRVVAMQQTHSAHVQIVSEQSVGRGALDWESAIPNTDALITDAKKLPLLVLVADCAPMIVVDPTHRVLAVVHAGWRGAVARIASQTVKKMMEHFDSKPEELRVGIGSCLCGACFEVGDDVVEAAKDVAPQAVLCSFKKPHLDLRALLIEDLVQHRVLELHIETLPHCPRCDVNTFFSYRGEEGATGRFGVVAWWE